MSLKNIKIIGMYPANAISLTLNEYDNVKDNEKLNILMKTYYVTAAPTNDMPKKFSSKQTIDIRAGELLGIGVIGLYYSILGQFEKRTFQVAVGIEDALKADIEKILVDGALWENETRQKMPFQETSVQGYFPIRDITTDDVISVVNHKIGMRSSYPENCGLIVSIFGESGQIDFKRVINECDLDTYQQVYVLAYDMPGVKHVVVTKLEKGMSAQEFKNHQRLMNLPRSQSDNWLLRESE